MSGEGTKKIAVLFPGQGAQYVGMAQDLFDGYPRVRDLFQEASDVVGIDCKHLLFKTDDEVLRQTENTQVAVTLANLSAFFALKEEGLTRELTAAAGFSLGEYAALVAAGLIDVQTCFQLVRERGRIMREQGERIIAERGPVGMAAVMGLSPESVESVLKISGRSDVFCANYNSPTQVVISGLSVGIDAVESELQAAGARRIFRLKVSGPFHTQLLEDAAKEFLQLITGINFRTPTCVLFSNVTGGMVNTPEEARDLLVSQISSPVRWMTIEQGIKALLGNNYLAIESGPGSVLCGLWKAAGFDQIYPAGKHEEIIQACSLL